MRIEVGSSGMLTVALRVNDAARSAANGAVAKANAFCSAEGRETDPLKAAVKPP